MYVYIYIYILHVYTYIRLRAFISTLSLKTGRRIFASTSNLNKAVVFANSLVFRVSFIIGISRGSQLGAPSL